MKSVSHLIVVFITVIILSSCQFNFNSTDLVEINDFEKQKLIQYELNDYNILQLDINVCTTQFEILTEDRQDIELTVYYDEDEVMDKLNFDYFNKEILEITNEEQKSDNCSKIKALDSFITIHLPETLNIANIDVNSYHTMADFRNIVTSDFIYQHVNGNVSMSNVTRNDEEVSNVEIAISNGNINVNDFDIEEASFQTVNGNIEVKNGKKLYKLFVKTSNGNL